MSVYASAACWKASKAKGGSLLVLLAIADFADENGVAYPSINTLARFSRLGRRRVQDIVRELDGNDELEIYVGAGPHGCNLYWVRAGRPELKVPDRIQKARAAGYVRVKDTPAEGDTAPVDSPPTSAIIAPLEGGAVDCTGGAISDTQGVQPTAPEPLSTHQLKKVKNSKDDLTVARTEALEMIAKEIGLPSYISWFGQASWAEGKDHRLIVKSKFIAKWVRSNYGDRLEKALGPIKIVVAKKPANV